MPVKANRQAFRVALTYIVVAGAYILLSNVLVKKFISNPDLRINITILKGWIFVLVTGALLYSVLQRILGRWEREVAQRTAAEAASNAALAKLYASEEQLRLVLDASADGLWDFNCQTGILELSPRYWEIIGYTPGEVAADLGFFQRLVHPDDWPDVMARRNAHLAGKTDQNIGEFRLVTKGGAVKWVWGRSKVVARGADGTPLRMTGTITDITERKLAQLALRESEEKFRQLAETITDVFWIASPDLHQIHYVSPGYERIWGRTAESLYANPQQWLETTFPEDRERVAAVFASLTGKEPTVSIEYRLVQPDGSLRWVQDRGFQVQDAAGKLIRLTGIAKDITESKRAEQKLYESQERYALAERATQDGLWDWNILTGEDYFSPRWKEIIGYRDDEIANQRSTFLELLHPDDQAVVNEATRGQIEKGDRYAVEFRLRHKDGSYRWVFSRAEAVCDATGRPIRMVGAVTDITERKTMEADLRRANHWLLNTQRISKVGGWAINPKTGEVWVSPEAGCIYGVGEKRRFTITEIKKFPLPEYRAKLDQAFAGVISGTSPYNVEFKIARCDDGAIVDIHSVAEYDADEGVVQGVLEDITERKLAEQNLRESGEKLAKMFQSSPMAISLSTVSEGRLLEVNEEYLRLVGRTREEVIGRTSYELGLWVDPGQRTGIVELLKRQSSLRNIELDLRAKSGHANHVLWSGEVLVLQGQRCLLGSALDITGRKHAELELQRSEQALKTICACNQAMVHAATEAELLQEICRVIVNVGGYRMAWVGFAENDEAKTVRVAATAGHEAGYLAEAKISWSEAEPQGRGPTGTAIRTGQINICQDMQTDPIFTPWQEAARWRGYASSISLPLRLAGKTFGIVMIYAAVPNAFSQAEVTLLTTMSEDLAYGIHTMRMRLQHHQAEAALRESEEKYRSLLTNAPVGIFQATPDHMLFVNPAAAAMFGYASPAEMLAGNPDPASLYVHPEQRSQLIREALTSGTYVSQEVQERRKDGSSFTSATHLRVVCDAAGEVKFVEGFVQDITEQRAAAAALEGERNLLRTLIDHIPGGIYVRDTANRFVLANEVQAQNLGVASPADLLGKTDADFFSAEQAARFAADDRGVFAGQPLLNLEQSTHHPTGKQCVMLVSKVPLKDAAGKVIALIGIAHDITERKRMEESHARLATAIEQAAETVVITDTKGTILYANPAFEKNSGYTRAEALGQNPRVLKSGKHDAGFYREMWATLLRGEVWSGHFTNRRKDGTLFEEEATISPIRDADGTIINYVAVKRDVTKEVELETQVRQSQKMEAIGTLAGGIAHDFNNMLAAIFGYAHLLQQDTEGNPLAQESVEEILKSANRAKELVQQILTFSRQRESSRQVIRLDSIIKEAMKFLRASLPANLKIDMQLAATAPAVLADATQIYQVTMNLATNALHAMEGRNGQLTVTLEPFQPDAVFLHTHPQLRPVQYARLTIADTGCGMDAKTLERIYEPFFTTKPIGKGTGLGLSVVHGIMKSHEGVITVESQVGQGTTFRLYFPAQIQAEAVAVDAGTAGRHAHGNGQRILFLDDEVALTSVVQKMLRRLDYQVTTSNSGGEVIRLVRANPAQFDLVITDLTMPEINGLEVARQLHAIRPELPVILMSGYSVSVVADSLRDAGICELLQKPVSLSALTEVVQRVLKQS